MGPTRRVHTGWPVVLKVEEVEGVTLVEGRSPSPIRGPIEVEAETREVGLKGRVEAAAEIGVGEGTAPTEAVLPSIYYAFKPVMRP